MSGKKNGKFQVNTSPQIEKYFDSIVGEVKKQYEIGERARKKGFDPVDFVEIPIADDLASRVEALVGPRNVSEKIREYLETGQDRVSIALKIAEHIVDGVYDIPESDDLTKSELETKMEAAIRTATAIITGGIVSAPLEGIEKIRIRPKTNHLAIYYASPIRSAGGTAAAMTVVVADYVRHLVHLEPFRASSDEVGRYVEEINLYKRVKNLQIPTTDEEIREAAKRIPLELNGSKTEKVEVSGYRDIPNHETNFVRGGLCLVFNDGVIGRAGKILKVVDKTGIRGWDWLKDLKKEENSVSDKEETFEEDEAEKNPELGLKTDSDDETDKFLAEGAEYGVSPEIDPLEEELVTPATDEYVPKDELKGRNLVKPKEKYLTDVIGGRPIFSHPTSKGGFRLRYGKSRGTGLAAIGMHPASMWLLKFIAPGTHVITERPGKGSIVTPVSTIEGPLVKLKDKSVRRIYTLDQAKKIEKQVDEILELGDVLVGFGEFLENNHPLIPSGYVEEWWVQELAKWIKENCESLEWLENQTGIDKARLNTLLEKPLEERPTAQEAIDLAKITGTYLHPKYTFLWHDLSISDLLNLRKWLKTNWNRDTGIIEGSADQSIKKILERAGISHKVSGNRISIKFFSAILIELLQLSHKTWEFDKSSLPKEPSALDLINTLSDIKVRWKAPVRTGCRMGRPEKARERKMKPPVHLLFPVGSGAGRKRDLIAITKEGSKTITEINYRVCPKCKQFTFRSSCYSCNVETTQIYVCPRGHESTNPVCDYCSELCVTYKKWAVSLQDEYYIASQRIGRSPTEIKGVIKLMNKNRQPEAIEKGILRAYHNIYTFKDGTTRFDMTDAPLTHFRPYEIGVSVQRLRELGYTSDIHGNPLEERDQVLEIFPQDIIVNEEALTYLVRVAKFVDDELARLYKLEPYYSVTWPKDLIGHLVIGLAPHTSTGIVGRIIGLTKAKVCWTHPYWHAAKRRNCLAGTEELLLWDTENHKLIVKPIGEIVEEAIHLGAMQEVVDDFGTTAIQNPYPYWQVISIDPNTRELVFQPIKHWIKGKSNQWIQIRTKKGRTIKMTTDHRALIWYPQKDKIRKVKAVNLNPNNYIPVVTQLNLPIQQPSSKINILQELADNLPDTPKFQTFKHQVRLRNADKWMKQSLKNYFKRLNPKKARITLKMIRELLPTYLGDKLPSEPYKKPFSTDWYNSIPLSHLQVLQQKEVFDWDDIPENAFLGMARDDLIVAPYIPFTTDLMRLLGYFISEGYIRDKYGCYQTNFSLPNPDLRKHVGLLIDQILGSVPYHKADNNQLIHSGRIHAYLFAYAWGIGTRALNKRIPSFIYTLPKNYRIHFLSALIDGDGTIIPSANRITLYTGHKNLAHDYCLLLSTLGVFARLHEGRGDRYGQKILERYKDLEVKPKTGTFLYYVNIPGKENKPLLGKLFLKHKEKREKFEKFSEAVLPSKSDLKNIGKQLISDRIKKVEVLNENASSYCLEVAPTDQKAHHNIVISNFLATGQCDGDEDSVFLLLDGLLNFSRSFLPDRIGGLMDAPLVLNVVLNPAEVDSEAFNVDTSWKYPLELYEASWRGDAPNKLSFIDIVERRLGDVSQYEGFGFTHDTQHIEAGPEVTLYKILDTMAEKIEAQLHIAQLVKAVDADDLAMRILKSHLLRDMTGCLRAFAAQKFRCIKCNTSYRRIPLVGYCRKCGGKIVLTVAPGSVLKYFNLARDLVDKYDVPEFTKNRVKLLDLRQKLLLGGKFHQSNLMDFFKKSKK